MKEYEVPEDGLLLSNPWIDFQQMFDAHLGFVRKVSLKLALEIAGLDFGGQEHDALDDARNTAGLLRLFINESRYDGVISKVKEAMEPSPSGCSLGEMFDFSELSIA